MKNKPQIKHNRRQLLRGTLRYATLSMVAAGTGAVIIKRKKLLHDGRCVNRSICKDCSILTDCGLPRALSVKQHIGNKANG